MHTAHLETVLQFQWPQPDVSPGDPQMNKFEQVSSNHHQISLAGRGGIGLMSGRGSILPYLYLGGRGGYPTM